MTIPKASVTNVGTVVTARCLPNRPILIDWFSDITHELSGAADSAGRFVRDLATEDPSVDMSGLEVEVACESSKGDRVTYRETLPA